MIILNEVTIVLLIFFTCLLGSSDSTGTLTSNLPVTDGVLPACPGDSISLTCTHDNTAVGVTRWEVNGVPPCIIPHDGSEFPTCGPLTITMVSGATGATLTSTARATATESLDGAVVKCRAGGLNSSPLVGNITVNALDIPTPTIDSVEQVSQSVVRVSMSVSDSQCVGSYQVEATPVGGNGPSITSSPTSTVDASGLNVCQYNYTLVGSVLSADGVESEPSSPESFSADFSVINGITVTVNQVDPLIEWEQMPNPSYPTCITGYFVDGQTGFNTTASSITRSLTAQQLNAAGFPYCTTIHPTVTPVTPMGPLETTGLMNTVIIKDPNFPSPLLSHVFVVMNKTLLLQVSVQAVEESSVINRAYHYTTNGVVFPSVILTNDSFEIDLSNEEVEHNVIVIVEFRDGVCESTASISVTVPSLVITGVTQGTPTDTSQSIAITLPLTEYQPEQLLIISTVQPSDDGPIMANYTSHSMQYTVTFTDLDPVTEYTFTIRIVLRSNTTVDVVPAVTGIHTTTTVTSPTTGETPSLVSSGRCGTPCIAGIAGGVGVVVILVVLVIFLLTIVILKKKEKAPVLTSTRIPPHFTFERAQQEKNAKSYANLIFEHMPSTSEGMNMTASSGGPDPSEIQRISERTIMEESTTDTSPLHQPEEPDNSKSKPPDSQNKNVAVHPQYDSLHKYQVTQPFEIMRSESDLLSSTTAPSNTRTENTECDEALKPSYTCDVTHTEHGCSHPNNSTGVTHAHDCADSESDRSSSVVQPHGLLGREFSSSDESDSLEWSTATGKIPAPTWV